MLDDFLRGTSSASPQRAARDLASAVTCAALLDGADAALDAARRVVGDDRLIDALPYLQGGALPPSLAAAVKRRRPELLADASRRGRRAPRRRRARARQAHAGERDDARARVRHAHRRLGADRRAAERGELLRHDPRREPAVGRRRRDPRVARLPDVRAQLRGIDPRTRCRTRSSSSSSCRTRSPGSPSARLPSSARASASSRSRDSTPRRR